MTIKVKYREEEYKPHIRMVYGVWTCYKREHNDCLGAIGSSPRQAYEKWKTNGWYYFSSWITDGRRKWVYIHPHNKYYRPEEMTDAEWEYHLAEEERVSGVVIPNEYYKEKVTIWDKIKTWFKGYFV